MVKEFSIRLKELRLKKGLSQKVLAKKLNVSVNVINDWETEKSQPNIYLLISIAINVKTDQLLGLKDLHL